MKRQLLIVFLATALAHQAFGVAASKKIQLSVCNKTDHILIIAARYKVLPSPYPGLASMPNPFVFKEAPAHETTYALFTRVGGGRLGDIEEVTIRTRNEDGPYDFKTFNAKELKKTNSEEILTITIDKDMLPSKS